MKRFLLWSLATAMIIAVVIVAYVFLNDGLKDLVNKDFPPMSPRDVQESSLRANQSSLYEVGQPVIAINLAEKDFAGLLDSAAKQVIDSNKVPIKHVAGYQISNITTKNSDQLVNISAAFDVKLDTLEMELAGSFNGVVSLNIKNDSLMLHPAFRTLHLDKISHKGNSNYKLLRLFVNHLLNNFKDNLSGLLDSKLKGISLAVINRKLTDTGIINKKRLQVTASKPVELSLPSLQAACMIDEAGIHILAAFVNDDFGAGPAYVPPPSEGFENDFKKFQQAFNDQEQAAFPSGTPGAKTFVLIKKDVVAYLLNQTLTGNVITGGYKDTLRPAPAAHELTVTTDDIDCSSLDNGLTRLQVPAVPLPSISNCHKWDFGCRILNKLHLKNYADAVQKYANPSYTVNAMTDLVVIAPTAVTCAATKEMVRARGGRVDLCDMNFSAAVPFEVNGAFSKFTINNDLSQAHIDFQLSARAGASVTYGLHPKNEAKLICAGNIDQTFTEQLSAQVDTTSVNFQLNLAARDNKIALQISTGPVNNFELQASPPPVTRILVAFGELAKCPSLTGPVYGSLPAITLVKKFDQFITSKYAEPVLKLVLTGKAEVDVPAMTFDLSIEAKPLKLLHENIPLSPVIQQTYLGFSD